MVLEGILIAIIVIIGTYFFVTWKIECRKNRMKIKKEKVDVINLGSTYAYYNFEYEKYGIKGYNLANVPQYLDYDMRLLKKYIRYMKNEGKVLIVLPICVFMANSTDEDKKAYYEVLAPWEMKHFKMRLWLKYLWRAAKEPFLHTYEKESVKWKGYVASYEEKQKHAEGRIADWQKKLGILSVKSSEIAQDHIKRIEENKRRICNMIELCEERGIEPILIVPPISEIIRKKISSEFLNSYLKQPIHDIVSEKKVSVIDYSEEKEFQNADLYMNSDCMNELGREMYTIRVLQDIGVLEE